MEVKKVAFAKSMKQPQDYPDSGLPEIAFAGKSNVGKSSLINYIANHSKLAYVSKQPGKTRLINYYLVNDCFYLVDLPGYGFARVSKTEKDSWDEMMRLYFEVAKNLKALIILVDIRHKPTQDDLQMIQWALYYGVPFCIAATKADKIAKSKRYHYAVQMAKNISAALEEDLDLSIIPISSTGKYGKDTLLRYVKKMITPGGTPE
ncbi:MAG: ribosome biogenesis GTP-binding protein YihA/YsxC [Christensenella sp.]|nr:ribosome biogenesis GTP-binding protein YihA/YsxC [Christensenella sp.]